MDSRETWPRPESPAAARAHQAWSAWSTPIGGDGEEQLRGSWRSPGPCQTPPEREQLSIWLPRNSPHQQSPRRLTLALLLDFNQRQSAFLLLSHQQGGNECPGCNGTAEEVKPHQQNSNEQPLERRSAAPADENSEVHTERVLRGRSVEYK